MAASNVVRSLLSVAFLVVSGVMAGTVSPSNLTLPATDNGAATNLLRLTGASSTDSKTYTIAPLTANVGLGDQTTANTITFSGDAVLVDYTTTSNLTSKDVALISCDPNGSNIDASTVVESAAAIFPQGIILYTTTDQSCELTSEYTFTTIFTMISQMDAINMVNITGTISPLTATVRNNGSSTTPPASTTANDGGPAPTTAVAMSILYSITGIITLLFLIIIATGAVRAHRHPERYGPRIGFAGRPRQSRAKGLARAMLETLPIVKFGDPEPAKPADVELASGTAHTRDGSVMTGVTNDEAHPAAVESGMGAAQTESVHSAEPVVPEGDLQCSICTEDFTAGEDVRVLPCNHRYHPACIDPWLLNVSGTCPLCRHDLRPSTSATNHTDEGIENDELPPPLSVNEGNETDIAAADDAPHRRRMSRFVDLRRLRNAPPDERIAALRSLREQSQRETAPPENTEERSRRARLTGRLRDTFRVRTRTGNAGAEASEAAPTTL